MIRETAPSDVGVIHSIRHRAGQIGWKHAAFFVGVPIMLGTWATFENWWLLETAGFTNALLFYCGHALLPWWLTCIVTALVMRLLARWKPHQVIIMLLGVSIALFISVPYGEWLDSMFLSQKMSEAHNALDANNVLDGRFARFWSYLLQPTILWVGINLLFDRLLDFPRYRYNAPSDSDAAILPVAGAEPAISASPVAQLPRFLAHLDEPPSLDDVYAIKAEQHYIKVHTPESDHMILYRFSDAIAELDDAIGMQIHRSFWIRKSAIVEIKSDVKKMSLVLESGFEAPVSQPYQALVRQTVEAQKE